MDGSRDSYSVLKASISPVLKASISPACVGSRI